mgnify:CR=1 FL=1
MYKVVQNVRGKRYSSYIGTPELRCHYPIGKPVTARVGGLLVFTNIQDARESAGDRLEVWKCHTGTYVSLPLYRCYVPEPSFEAVHAVWNASNTQCHDPSLLDLASWPDGTVAVHTVTLTTLVKPAQT